MTKKCPTCNGCTTPTWILDRKRVFWCFLCRKYYDIIDGKFVEVNKEDIERSIKGDS